MLNIACRFLHILLPIPRYVLLSRLGQPANKERHIGVVTPQQHDERPQGWEGREGAGERQGGDSAGLHSLFGQCEEGSVFGVVQEQFLLRVEATQVGTLVKHWQSWKGSEKYRKGSSEGESR